MYDVDYKLCCYNRWWLWIDIVCPKKCVSLVCSPWSCYNPVWYTLINDRSFFLGELSLYSPLCCSKPCRGTLERTSKTDKEDDKLLNNVVIFVFFAHKMCSRSFTTLRLNHWSHMDYFNDVLTTFLGLEHGSCVAVYGESESSPISSNISSFMFRWWSKVLRVWNDTRVSN